jgi:hypothetical protein
MPQLRLQPVCRLVEAHFAQFCNQVARPAIDVALSNHLAHALHPGLPFLAVHLQGDTDGFRHLFDVVGVHQ